MNAFLPREMLETLFYAYLVEPIGYEFLLLAERQRNRFYVARCGMETHREQETFTQLRSMFDVWAPLKLGKIILKIHCWYNIFKELLFA